MENDNQDQKTRKKIAILGGGMSALSAAFELTDYEGWDEDYDITLYQMGWRLGGKCATGRGPNDRIEEHGIHVFLGFYNNAIRMVRLAYDAWRKMDGGMQPDYPFQEWESVFHLQNSIMLPEKSPITKEWSNWSMVFPENDLVPGMDDGPPSKQVNIKKMILLMLELILGSPYQQKKKRGCVGGVVHSVWSKIWPKEKKDIFPPGQPQSTLTKELRKDIPHWWDELSVEVEKFHGHKSIDATTKYLHHAQMLAETLPEDEETAGNVSHDLGIPHTHSKIVKLLERFVIEEETRIINSIHHNEEDRRFWILAQIAVVNFRGLNEDCYQPETGTYDFDKINDMEYRAWLLKWGASQEVAYSSPVRDIYTLVFAYPDGDTSKAGSIGAGTAVQGAMLIILGYKGSVMYRFHGGTAEVIGDPVYNVLKGRGVKFRFFNEVEQVHYSKSNEIESISIREQVRLRSDEEEFMPTRRIKGLNCWPSHPFWQWTELGDQIDDQDLQALKAGNINLESAWSGWKGGISKKLEKGVDFDQVILGISVAGLKDVCSEIIDKKDDWKGMVDKVQTVQTQAVQLWMKEDLKGIGMDLPKLGLEANASPILDTYEDPINSYADMSELKKWEDWPDTNEARSIAYFCGPMLQKPGKLPPYTDGSFPAEEYQRVVDMARDWFSKNAGFLWPDATMEGDPNALDYSILCDPENNTKASNEQKFAGQFFRANIDPSERYVLSVPGSHQFRKKTDESGYDNLFLTGDWIDTGYNMGMVECAVIAGLMAAQAVRKTYGFSEFKPILKDL